MPNLLSIKYYYETSEANKKVPTFTVMNINTDTGEVIDGYIYPSVKLIHNGVTYSDFQHEKIQLQLAPDSVLYGTLVYFNIGSGGGGGEPPVTDQSACVGSAPGCKDVSDVISVIDKTTAKRFELSGDNVKRDIVITPKDTMQQLSVFAFKGSITIKKNDLQVYLEGNEDLQLKLQGTGKFQEGKANPLDSCLITLMSPDHGLVSAEFTFSDIGKAKEINVAFYPKMDGFKVPTFSATGDKRKYTLKTKEVPIPTEVSKKLKAEEPSELVIAYFEVSGKLSGGEIAGIVIGCIVGVAAIAVGVFFAIKKIKSKEDSSDPAARA